MPPAHHTDPYGCYPRPQSSWAYYIASWKIVDIEAGCADMDKYEEMEKIGEGVRKKNSNYHQNTDRSSGYSPSLVSFSAQMI